MIGSQNIKSDLVLTVYKDIRTVFRLKDIAMLTGETSFESLNKKLNYYVRTGKLQNPRKGIYTKPDYNPEELACTIYTPSYISLETVFQMEGMVFQFDSTITAISYLSRNIDVENRSYQFRKIKGELLVNTSGITRKDNQINIATPERAFLDALYLKSDYYFDNLSPLNRELVYKLLPLYQSKVLTVRVKKLLTND
ncbi:MAG: hypothetical protein Q8P34_14055 [Bacteroidota bacterium]|nr:hypothetical protein [Bacteroidota bacterium]